MTENRLPPSGPELPRSLEPLRAEIATYYRELPRLLVEGHAGRFVLIKGQDLIGVYDTDEGAYDVGAERYGFGPFLAQPVDARDLDRLAPFFPPYREAAG